MPCFLEGGVNTMFPVEVNAGTDPVALRAKYGKQLRLWGGVDKMIFLKDKAAVDRELQRLRPVVEEGGFIPTVDHRVQADAKLDLYKHYLDRKREWFNVGGEPRY
jgi:uroporphyrinogen decarboxylase